MRKLRLILQGLKSDYSKVNIEAKSAHSQSRPLLHSAVFLEVVSSNFGVSNIRLDTFDFVYTQALNIFLFWGQVLIQTQTI